MCDGSKNLQMVHNSARAAKMTTRQARQMAFPKFGVFLSPVRGPSLSASRCVSLSHPMTLNRMKSGTDDELKKSDSPFATSPVVNVCRRFIPIQSRAHLKIGDDELYTNSYSCATTICVGFCNHQSSLPTAGFTFALTLHTQSCRPLRAVRNGAFK